MKYQRSFDINLALLSLYECAIDPDQFPAFVATMESWLSTNASPEALLRVEDVSKPLWENLSRSQQYLELTTVATERAPRFILADYSSTVDPTAQDDWDCLKDTIFAEDLSRLRDWMAGCANGAQTLIRAAKRTGASVVYIAERADNRFQLTDIDTELESSVEDLLIDSFRITHSEMAVLRHLVVGKSVREVSSVLGKSSETIRTQIKSLAQKLSVNRQQDIQRLVGNIQARSNRLDGSGAPAQDGKTHRIKLDAGRHLFYTIYGSDNGFPVILCPDFSGGSYMPKGTAHAFKQYGLRAIVLTRAGYGASDPVDAEGSDLINSHCEDHRAVLDAENVKNFAVVGAGTGMALAYSLALRYPQEVVSVIGLNIYPPVQSHQDAMHFKSGMYRVGALASLYAPVTLRVLTRFVVAQAARIRTAKQLLALSGSRPEQSKGVGSYYADYLKPNLESILAGKGKGSAADCTYLATDWPKTARQNLNRPPTLILHHSDFPFVSANFTKSFAAKIGARFLIIRRKFRESHRDVKSLAQVISESIERK